MEEYIKGNKEAWEEAFDKKDEAWGTDIVELVNKDVLPFFNEDTKRILQRIDLKNKVIGQFCCNNGRELLSLAKNGEVKKAIGFDIAENQVAFANSKAKELNLPCDFVAVNIYDIDDEYTEQFDLVIITIGALCWFKDLKKFFEIISRCMKKGANIIINEVHPCANMIATEGEELYDSSNPLACKYSYFEHEWTGNEGMYYITKKSYVSKTFTDYTHPLSEIMSSMCENGIVITEFQEFEYDISGGFKAIENLGYPLSMIIQGVKK